MAHPLPNLTRSTTGVLCAAAVAIAVFTSAPASAQPHRARLSADLADHLSAQSPRLDVIVHGDKAEVEALAARYNLVVKRYLKTGAVLRINAGQLSALEQDDAIDHLSGDTIIRSTADVTAESIGADQVWAGDGDLAPLSGDGVTIAVIDTGIDTRHAALRRRVIFTKDFTGGDGMDRFGHGTHVAGIIAGALGRTADTRDYCGITYGASLINLRALGDDGSGTVSTVVDAIDWAVDHRRDFNIRIINLSLGTPVLQPYRDDPLCEAVERAADAGILVVVAAGNQGRSADGKTVLGSITSPGNSPHALTVGAIDAHDTPQRSDDTLATYSSRGPTRYDLIIKPDLAAPGSHVVSAEASDAYLAKTYPARHVAGSGANAYMQLSGTSMAPAVVSGAAALLIEQRSQLRPSLTKIVLQEASTFDSATGLLGSGAGSLNVLSASEMLSRRGDRSDASSTIGGELVHSSGLAFGQVGAPLSLLKPVAKKSRNGIVRNATLVWGANGTLVWGASDTLVWGSTLVWGANLDTLVWGATDTLVWGSTLVWGAGGDTLVWGASGDTLVWGSSTDTLVWGASAGSFIEDTTIND